MTLIVHGRASSSNVQAVMWGLAELGLTVDRRDVGGRFGGTDTSAFRALNPMGRIPVLQDGDVTVFESAAILRYLLTHYNSDQIAIGPQHDAWAEWAKWTCAHAFTLPVFWAYYRTPENQRDMNAVMAALRNFEALLSVAMAQRATSVFLMGEKLSLADIWVGHVLYRYFALDLPRDVPQGLMTYYAMLCERPAYQVHVMIEFSELQGRLSF